MTEPGPWLIGTLVGAIFALVITPASADVGAFTFILNLIALGCFVAPLVALVRERRAAPVR